MSCQQHVVVDAPAPHNLDMTHDGLPRANAPLARMFAYNAWANAGVIDACRKLDDAQLDAPSSNAFGSIRSTLQHVIYGQYSFLARLDGDAQDARALALQWPGFDALTVIAAETSEALTAAASALDVDADVVLSYQGKGHRYPKSFFLLHTIQHGIEHRTQIGMMLAQLGCDAPDLDGWAFAEHAGLGGEI
jgi:uncharacterized damage-inducible protein DinB